MFQKIKKQTFGLIKRNNSKLYVLKDPRALGLVAFGFLMVLITYSGVKVAQDNYNLAKKISIQMQKNDIASLENENLKLSNQYYQTDQYLELSARRQFGRASPGEKVYVIPEVVALSHTIDMPQDTSDTKKSHELNKPQFIKNLEAWVDYYN